MKQLIILLLLLCSGLVWAHPHVWIESRLNVHGSTVDIVWEFDEMFSNILFSDFDIDRDRQFTGMEVKKLKADMFDNLVNFDYFMRGYCGNDMLEIGSAENFSISSTKKKVTYKFSLNIPIKNCKGVVQLYNYDETYYSDISVVQVSGNGTVLQDDVGGRKFVEIK
ncbi:ABC-type uncharacterized transport system periplasmic component-like protein [Denitrovibrio acetiphilus DSM 12809]|uniref:ABC-type uncharacterized transport system periplasmic component-like protein n=1 Tax=Denitrovibrio acetiphilus (strain DSM 12809 / NBRC 114555 / N2460) TaxID=522772 RepID=D4H309_DENA2|nr:DUF1007 family protein [Denitrovibrio acetiphilus]ADD69032.1 ABC-type uncharacterized transport system periplasmic component-like protein [Denitrovibrio acetiphilus DSM 12809]